MITIAVCDDTAQYLQESVALLEQWSKEKNTAVKIDAFDNGDSLIQSMTHQPYDLIFLDIIMPMFSGIDTCAEIRKENSQTKIIFLSVSPEFGVDAFRVKANGYLLKPLDKKALFDLMDEYLAEKKATSRFLIARSMSMYRKVPLHTVSLLEAQNKRIMIYTTDGNALTLTTPLHQLTSQLDNSFFQCHRSYIVNMNQIRSLSKTEMTMADGRIIPISRNYSKDLHNAYFEFLFGKAGDLS